MGLRSESLKLGQGQRKEHDAPWVLSTMTPRLTSGSDSMGSLLPAPRFEHLQVPPQRLMETFEATLSLSLMLSSGTVISRPNGTKKIRGQESLPWYQHLGSVQPSSPDFWDNQAQFGVGTVRTLLHSHTNHGLSIRGVAFMLRPNSPVSSLYFPSGRVKFIS